jgi:hypothetical protein
LWQKLQKDVSSLYFIQSCTKGGATSASAPGTIIIGGANTFLLILFCVNFPVNKSTTQSWQYDS